MPQSLLLEHPASPHSDDQHSARPARPAISGSSSRQGDTGLELLIGLAFAGAMLGDHFGHLVGNVAGPILGKKRWVRKQLIKRKQGYRKHKILLNKSALWAICIGRLYPTTRSITPVRVGALDITLSQFFVYDLLACTIWACGLTILVFSAGQI